MNKEDLIQRILERLSTDLEILLKAARTAHAAATHEENIADNKYDTLSLEASYIAQAQANRAQEIRVALDAYRGLAPNRFEEGAPIRLTALVTLEDGEGRERKFFVGPEAGGLKIASDGDEIVVITPHSPVGRQLIGRTVGDAVEMSTGSSVREYEIVEVC